MTTFQILDEIRALYALMSEVDENGECLHSDDDLEDFVKEIGQSKSKKLNNMQDLKIEIQHSINALDEKIEKLNARKKALNNDIERIKNLQLMLLDGEKFKTDEYNFFFMKTQSVNIDTMIEAKDFDKNYVRVAYEFDKTKLKTAIKDGVSFDGVSLIEKQSLVVK